jgi:hypothetical protein
VKPASRFGEREQRLALLGAAIVLILGLIIGFGWMKYQDWKQPDKTILSVQDQKFSLRYYSDRLFLAAQAAQSTGQSNLAILEQTLLGDLENEALARIVATEKGITVSEDDVTAEIASQLGVPAGGSGSSFDVLYRQRLTSTKMSDGAYRTFTRAQVYQSKLKDQLVKEMGDTGEKVTLRTVVSASKADADKVFARVSGGEDLGTVAQTESADSTSRQQDGLQTPEPTLLLPDAIQAAIKDKPEGTELFGPIDVAGNFWVFRIEKRDASATYSDTEKSQLGDLLVKNALTAKKPQVTIKRNINSDDYAWATKHAGD